MHNKLLIADGVMAVAGGRNIADEYFMASAGANFVDLDTFVIGAIVPRLARLFDEYWNSPCVFPISVRSSDQRAQPREALRPSASSQLDRARARHRRRPGAAAERRAGLRPDRATNWRPASLGLIWADRRRPTPTRPTR